MMFLIEDSLLDLVKKQYYFKLKAYKTLFFTLIVVQLIAQFLSISIGGVGSMGFSGDGISISVKLFSGEIVIVFTMIWVFLVARLLTTEPYRDADFVFISNRLSSNLSNIAFLLTASIAGGMTASLSGVLLRVIAYFYFGSQNIASQNFHLTPQDLLVGIIASILYLFLCSAVGYFLSTLTQMHKAFIVLLPLIFFGTLFFEARLPGDTPTFVRIIQFFINESSLVVFLTKYIVTASILFYSVIVMSNRMEVRK